VKIKICGITTLADALACAQAGADLLGFNFYPPSPRYLTPEDCAPIAAVLRKQYPQLILAGVFVNETGDSIRQIMEQCQLDLIQCSGDETPGMLQKYGPASFKALRPAGWNDLRAAAGTYPARTLPPAFLIDAYRPGEFGGTGQTADWSLAASLAARLPILLAGGLNPENVAAAVRQVRPWGLDVASGVETEARPASKDADKVKAFITAALAAAED
jgi:phosphoribosylanthranilate isomerase